MKTITALLRTTAFAVLVFAAAALRAAVIPATYNSAADVPVTASSIAAGDTVNFTLNFAPPIGTQLTVVRNPGIGFISGTFANLAQGQTVALNFGTTTYNFVANYYGGTGNDLVLVWSNTTRPYAWGSKDLGLLGNGTTGSGGSLPVAVTKTGVLANKTVVAMTAGFYHTLALHSDGTMSAWGGNNSGMPLLGNGSTGPSAVPVLVDMSGALAGSRVVAIAAGEQFSLALSATGVIYGWGMNTYGQLGNNSNNGNIVPQVVGATGVLAGKTIVAIATGANHSLALASDGTLAAWGVGGSLGDNSTTTRLVPTLVTTSGVLAGRTVIAIGGGLQHSLALCSDGTLAAWGANFYGELGNNSTNSQSLVPVQVTASGALSGKTPVSIAVGSAHNLVLCADGTLVAWGRNVFGQLGDNSTTNRLVPVNITGTGVLAGKTVVAIAAGRSHSVALCSDGTTAAWGWNFYKQLGNTTPTQSLVPVAVDTTSMGANARISYIFSGPAANHVAAVVSGPPPVFPEIAVVGNSINIPNGASTPSLADHTDFGSVMEAGNATQTRTYTVKNTGSADLNLTGTPAKVVVSGAHAADFTVTAAPAALVAAFTGTTTFQVTFNPSALGLRTATLSIANDDSDENPYVFAIQGTGAAPEIDVVGNTISIPNGSLTPSLTNHTDFGDVPEIGNTTLTRTFTLKNTGSGDLSLTGIPNKVVVSGGNAAADFTVTLQPTTPVAGPTGTTPFQITFNPSASGLRTANVSIANDDSDENPYVFAIQGNGTATRIEVLGNGVVIADGDSTPAAADFTQFGNVAVCTGATETHTFTIHNFGTAPLNLTAAPFVALGGVNAGDFIVTQPTTGTIAPSGTTTFNVTFDPSAPGVRSATLSIATDDANASLYDFALAGTGVSPEIDLTGGNNVGIVDGATLGITANGTNFGAVALNSSSPPHTFTITNLGTAPLNLIGTPKVTVTGANAGDFTVTQPASPIAVSATATFTITFTPGAIGGRNAIISIANDDCDESTYDFVVAGNGIGVPEIEVLGGTPALLIASGDLTPTASPDDGTVFGNVFWPGTTSLTHTFTIHNLGTATLNVTGIVSSNPAEFTTGAFTPGGIAPTGTMTFDVKFDPGAAGLRSANITISNDDSDEGTYVFAVQGTGGVPDMVVRGNSVTIPDGTATTTGNDGTDFADVAVCTGATATHTFTIHNFGNAPLQLNGSPLVVLGGPNAGDFIVSQPTVTTIGGGGGFTNFSVTFDPSVAGIRTATLSIASTDNNVNPYNFTIAGNGIAPEIDVTGGGGNVSIVDGSTLPTTTSDTDFGSIFLGNSGVSHTFTIRNLGTAPLTLLGNPNKVIVTGPNAGEFTVTQPTSPIATGGASPFTVTFNPTGLGVRTAIISIVNDDCDESTYDFVIQGTCIGPGINVSGGNPLVAIVNGATITGTGNGTDFGAVLVGSGAPVTQTYTITNTGSAPLHLTGLIVRTTPGTNPGDFVVTQPSLTTIPANNGTTTFTVTFTPGAVGPRTATISIPNDGSIPNPYTFAILGNGIAPGIYVTGGSPAALISAGDTSPIVTDGTDFGSVPVGGNPPVTHIFTIRNPGSSPLHLTGPIISTTPGANPGDFVVGQPGLTTLPANGGSTTFPVTFSPTAAGQRTATIAIPNDATSPLAYTFAVVGNGIVAPRIAVQDGQTLLPIANGDLIPSLTDHTDFGGVPINLFAGPNYFNIWNYGNAPVNVTAITSSNPAEFIVNAVSLPYAIAGSNMRFFNIVFVPQSAGLRTANITIANDDPTANPYVFAVQGNSLVTPAIEVRATTTNRLLVNGQTAPGTGFTSDQTDFGGFPYTGGATATHSFTIRNGGTGPLNVTAITSSIPSEFPVSGISPSLPTSVAANGTMTFNVAFDPNLVGPRSAVITVNNDDPTANPFTFAVVGVGIGIPSMEVRGGNPQVVIANGSVAPSATNDTLYPATLLTPNDSVPHVFTIANPGSGPLNITGITSSNSGEFAVSGATTPTIPGGNNTSPFTVTFNPSVPGTRTAIITVTNGNSLPPYTFKVQGDGSLYQATPEVNVTGNGANILSGSTTTSLGNHTNFGTKGIFSGTQVRTFTIQSLGTPALTVGPVSKVGGNAFPSEFTILTQPATSLPGLTGTTTFTVKFDPLIPGNRTTVLSFSTNDITGGENPYTFTVSGKGIWGLIPGSGWTRRSATVSWTPASELYGNTRFAEGTDDLTPALGTPRSFAWGDNTFGQLGNGTAATSLLPALVNTTGVLAGKNVVELAVGQNHSVALSEDGTLAAWGQGISGQLGNGTSVNSLLPVAVNRTGALAGKTVIAIASGQSHTLALCSDGTLAAWGGNGVGQLGNGTTNNSSVPVMVSAAGVLSGKTVTAIAAGDLHSVALCSDGTVATWGANTNGQLGNGTTAGSSLPVLASTTGVASALGGRTIVAIAAGAAHTLAACSDGIVAAWGRNAPGQLGDGTTTDRSLPVLVSTAYLLSGRTVVAMAAGANHTLAVCSDDTLVAWGENTSGQLGNNSNDNSPVPVAVERAGALAGRIILGVAAGSIHSVVLCADGTLAAWGDNGSGQLGSNGTTGSAVPRMVANGDVGNDGRFTRIFGGSSAARTAALAAPLAPEIGVSLNSVSVFGGTTPVGTGIPADFGSVVANGGTAARAFTVVNSGAVPLNLTGTPKVAVSGANAAEFSVTALPASPVASRGGTTTFAVAFTPLAIGRRVATLTLATDDPAQASFTFDLQGTGTTPANLDPSVRPGPNNLVYTTAGQPDGRNVLGGNFTGFSAGTPNRAARLLADGTLDLTFNPDADDLVTSVLVQPDGGIILGGAFTTLGGVARNHLARVDGNGILDPAFNPDVDGSVSAIALQPDGKIVIAGGFSTVAGVARSKIARLNANGTLDAGFDPNVNRAVYTIAVQPDGKILLGGNFDTVGGVTRNRIARVNANGALDTAFDPNVNSDVTSLALQADGRIVFGGQFTTVGGVTRNRVARITVAGTLDTGYDPNVDSAVYSMAAQTDGKVIIGGAFNNVGGAARVRIARLNADGTPDASFISSTEDLVFSTAVQADGKVVIAGYFFTVGGVSSRSLARLDNDTATQSLIVPNATRVQWLRGGASPETSQVTFEVSTNGGATWSLLGAGGRLALAPGWELTGLNLAGEGLIRARARTLGGAYTGSSGLVETITAFSFATAPVITVPPVSQSAVAGATVTLTVTATGTPPLAYQWMKGGAAGSVAISGATNASLTLTNVQASDAASYVVVVTNGVRSTTSAAANLTVTAVPVTPVITTQPTARSVIAGGNVTLSVVASSTTPLNYQWRKGGTAITGETNANLVFTAVAPSDAGSYDVLVGNAAGATLSSAAQLTVNTPPAISLQPVSLSAGAGTGVVFTASATGTPSLTYQWSKDGTDISGATTPSLALGNLALTDSGLYRLTVRNLVGTAVSNPAQLTVLDAFPTHAVSGPGYIAGSTVTIVNQLTYSATTSGLGWQLLLPAGWSYASGSGNEGDVKPVVGTTNLIEWAWTAIPTGPLTFSYTLNVPAGTTGAQQLIALAIIRQTGVAGQIMAKPDPLVVNPVTRHSADTDSNQRIDLPELTRVIALYNTRNGTVRTGAYGVVAVSEDGFAPDPNRANGAVVTLPRYHSGDTDLNGKLSLVELTRVIELYNVRSGTTRTGAYHAAAGTEDGFAPGP